MNKKLLFESYPCIKDETMEIRATGEDEFEQWYAMKQSINQQYTPAKGKVKSKAASYNILTKHFLRDFKKNKYLSLGIYPKNEDGKVVGSLEVFDIDERTDMLTIGYSLGEDYCGKGYARHAVRLLLTYLFKEIKVNRIQAFVMPENKKSAEVLLHNGFQKEGTLRKGVNWNAQGIIDIDLYSKLLEDED